MGNSMSSDRPVAAAHAYPSRMASIALLVMTGAAFGLGLNKSGVFRAEVIRSQFAFTNFHMLRTFLVAAAASSVSITVLDAMGIKSRLGSDAKYAGDKRQGLASVVLGASMLGIGMAVSAGCPGTIYAQLGSGWSQRSLTTFLGAVLGAAAFVAVEPQLTKFKQSSRLATPSLYHLFGVSPTTSGLGVAALMVAVALASEALPSTSFYRGSAILPSSPPGASLIDQTVWSPYVAGPLIGALQIPLAIIAGKNLGTSTTFAVYACKLFAPLYRALGVDTSKYTGWSTGWQVAFVAGIAGGASLSMLSTGSPMYNPVAHVSLMQSLVGGFFMSAGARVAGGCTSGHGISGMGFQGLNSVCAVASMFGAGGLASLFLLP